MTAEKEKKRLVVGISGASGMIYAAHLLAAIPPQWQVHLVVSEEAQKILKAEIGWDFPKETFREFAKRFFTESRFVPEIITQPSGDHFAPVASGSFRTDGMVVIPCSMKTLSGIANGYAQTLIERSADVHLKEKRKLILVVRETPYNQIHIRNMLRASEAGAVVLPASPGFYHHPRTIDDLAQFIVARILNVLNIPQNLFRGWKEEIF